MNALFRILLLSILTVFGTATISACDLFVSKDDDANDTVEDPAPPPSVACDDIVLQLGETSSPPNAATCTWQGQTGPAPVDVIQNCLVDPSTLSGTQDNPGIGNIEILHNGSQIAFAGTANGVGPWTYTVGAIDCNAVGTCGGYIDEAEYMLIVSNPQERACADFGDISLTLDLKS